ncbi:MAG: hypothetical protein COB38_02615 [Gammaproteobacteria bacterium]|nr:MAG: hypothetical protein COB38_02615 [Gammaproteobacteria bacterium]
MKFKPMQIILVLLAVTNIQVINAETQKSDLKAQVVLVDGKKFRDYELTNYSRSKSLQILEKDFNRVFTKLSSKYLKDGQSISISVTNLDLPGDLRFSVGPNHQDIRIVRDISPMKLYFNYKILAKDGSVVSVGEYKIKEFLHLSSHSKRLKHRGNLAYFMPLLEKWFKSEFT